VGARGDHAEESGGVGGHVAQVWKADAVWPDRPKTLKTHWRMNDVDEIIFAPGHHTDASGVERAGAAAERTPGPEGVQT
jgi:hypothetical protein